MTEDFSTLGLSTKVTEAVTAAGYTKPTEIQAQAIPHVLQKQDVIGIAQTGTGKTASFVLPMLTLLEKGRARARMPRTLILEPTRELAAQVHENFEKYGVNHKLTVALLIGGVSFEEQNKKLDRGADVLIATPGRMLDHFERGKLLLTGVDVLVIDEADRMLDMGFIPDIERICSLLPKRRQTLFFSATMPPEIQKLTSRFLTDPVKIETARQNSTAETINQGLMRTGIKPAEKRATLRDLIRSQTELTNAIVFCNRKRDVATLQRSLAQHGFNAGALHGDMDQKSRMETLEQFKTNKLTILVASDVAARGLDIPAVSHVFNFDIPVHAEDYVHRIGRTGRAGRAGTAVTLITSADTKHLDAISKLIQKDIPFWADSAEAEAPAKAEKATTPKAPRKRGTRKSSAAKPDVKDAESKSETKAESAPETTQEPVVAQAPANDSQKKPGTRGKSRPENATKQAKPGKKGSPFGEDSPIPAFLLRSALKAE